jgi:hypothetical protein
MASWYDYGLVESLLQVAETVIRRLIISEHGQVELSREDVLTVIKILIHHYAAC